MFLLFLLVNVVRLNPLVLPHTKDVVVYQLRNYASISRGVSITTYHNAVPSTLQ